MSVFFIYQNSYLPTNPYAPHKLFDFLFYSYTMKQYDLHEILVNDEHTWPKLQTINPRLHQLYYIGNISLLTQPLLGVV